MTARVISDPAIAGGAPIVAGTGIPIEAIADRFLAGDSIEELSKDFCLDSGEIELAIRKAVLLKNPVDGE